MSTDRGAYVNATTGAMLTGKPFKTLVGGRRTMIASRIRAVVIAALTGVGMLLSIGASFAQPAPVPALPSGGSTTSLQLKTPVDYGALCDGTTDDSLALQAWLDGIKNYAFLGWGLAGRTCIFGNNTNFAAPGLMAIRSKTIIVGNYMTLKLKNSGPANSGLTWANGTIDQVHGSDFTDVSTLIIDGNRGNQTNTIGSGALFYVIGSTHVTMRDNQALNSRADGFYFGGDSSLATNTAFVLAENLFANNNYRNGMSIVGVDRATFIGGNFNSNTNTTNRGPQCGVDFESNAGSTTLNSNITVFGGAAHANGGTLSTTGGSGWCFFGPNGAGIQVFGIGGSGNQRYGVHNAQSRASVTLFGVRGASNGTSLLSSTTLDVLKIKNPPRRGEQRRRRLPHR
jgi:hypothetical protein